MQLVLFCHRQPEAHTQVFFERLLADEKVQVGAVILLRPRPDERRVVRAPRPRLGTLCSEALRRLHDHFVAATEAGAFDLFAARGVPVVDGHHQGRQASEAYVRDRGAELGVIIGPCDPGDGVYQVPTLGSLYTLQHDPLKYQGASEIGRMECLRHDGEVRLSVQFAGSTRAAVAVLASRSLPIESLDTSESLKIKADVLTMDLCLTAIDAVASGTHHITHEDHSQGETADKSDLQAPIWQMRRRRREGLLQPPGMGTARRKLTGAARLGRYAMCVGLLPLLCRYRRKLEGSGHAPIVVFCFHGVGNSGDNWMTLPLEELHGQISYLRRHYTLLSLDEALGRLRSASSFQTAAVLTFDDGYRSCYQTLLSYLEFYQIPATFFVCPRALERGGPLPERPEYADAKANRAALMTPSQVRELCARGFQIGSHGNDHEDMGRLGRTELTKTLVGSADGIEQMVGQPTKYFSFPFGEKRHLSAAALAVARTRYEAVFSSYGGYNLDAPAEAFHFQRICAPANLETMITVMSGLHRLRPFYVDRPKDLA